MRIYTGKGDAGETGLFDGRRVGKDHPRIEAYGTIDELNSLLGLALAECRHEPLRAVLGPLQAELFVLGADLATPADSPHAGERKGGGGRVRRIGPDQITALERHIDAATAAVPPLQHFILPGGGVTAARLQVARTVCRRAERLAVALQHHEKIGLNAVVYLNRLGDLLFVLARWANRLEGVAETEWRGQAD